MYDTLLHRPELVTFLRSLGLEVWVHLTWTDHILSEPLREKNMSATKRDDGYKNINKHIFDLPSSYLE